MTQKFVYSIFYGSLFTKSQNILLSRWLHPKLISTLKFLSNSKIMFWVISQEQHSIKTLELTETNNYFYSFTNGKNTFSSSSYQWIDFLWIYWHTEKLWIQQQYCLLDRDTNQASICFPCIRYNQMSKHDRLIN